MDWRAGLQKLPTDPDFDRPGFHQGDELVADPLVELIGGAWLVISQALVVTGPTDDATLIVSGTVYEFTTTGEGVPIQFECHADSAHVRPDDDDLHEVLREELRWDEEPFADVVRAETLAVVIVQIFADTQEALHAVAS